MNSDNNEPHDTQFNLNIPAKTFFSNLRRCVFYLQAAERSSSSFEDINNFNIGQHIVQIQPTQFQESEYNELVMDYKVWCRQRVVSDLVEEAILLFKIHAMWLDKLNNNMGKMLNKEYEQLINKLITTQTSMASAIRTLEEHLKINIDAQFKSFLIALYKIRNSITHHQGFSLKSEIELVYMINRPIIIDAKGVIHNLEEGHVGLTMKEAFPDLIPDEDGTLGIGVKYHNHKVTLSESEYINISYEQAMDIIFYFSTNMRRIVSTVHGNFKRLLASK